MAGRLFMPLPAPEEMAEWDRLAGAEYGLPPNLLMENAGREAFLALQGTRGLKSGERVLVLAGKGNNGGDGLVLARYLHNAGCVVRVFTLASPDQYSGPALFHLQAARSAGVEALEIPSRPLEIPAAEIIVDAMLGAGFRGSLAGRILDLVRVINRRKKVFILALDLPSGLGGLSGRPEPEAVRADLTVTFAAPKPGLCLPWSARYVGELKVRDIGLPSKIPSENPPLRRLIRPARGVLPPISPYTHKGRKGKVLVLGGSSGLEGAPLLSALGAARAGSGLVTLAAPAPYCMPWRRHYPEIMTLPLEANNWNEALQGRPWSALTEKILRLGENAALVLGPGLGEAGPPLLRAALNLPGRPPLVLDADGLRPFPGGSFPLEALRPEDVLTPHPGEMIRLLEGMGHPESSRTFILADLEEQAGREAALGRICARTAATVLLKGPGTLVARRGAPLNLLPLAEPSLAVAGSGDVLSGVIAAFLARAFSGEEAASLGAWLHGRAGRILARLWPAGGGLASDLAEALPVVMKELLPSVEL
ncbi:MAG: NAD(P)H-hydrate dehydratase [Desulfovibrionaceae bacterium]|nr:NAD(P)H-hydrate dehydratase [Desulfovibrionaceae bacterium]